MTPPTRSRHAAFRSAVLAALALAGLAACATPFGGTASRGTVSPILDDCLNGTTSGADVTTGAPPPNAAPAPKQ